MALELGIRGKLLLLAIGIAVPLLLVGAFDLRNMWQLSRAQLDDSVKQQVDLASVALERWLDDQKKGLAAIAASAADNDIRLPAIRDNLEKVLHTRPFWMDLRVTDAAGTVIIAQPARRELLSSALSDYLVAEMRKRNSWVVVTDRTLDEARPIVIIAVPIETGGAVIVRIDGAAINELFDTIELSQHVVISVLDSNGRVLYRRRGSEAPTDADVSWTSVGSAVGAGRTSVLELRSPIDGINRVYGVAHIRDTGLITMIGIPSSTLYEPARHRLNRYALIGLLGLLLAMAAALVIERSIVLPVRRLRSAAQRLGGGDLTARAPLNDAGEIGELGAAFNKMATRIEEREQRLAELDRLKSEFVGSVSHELKTPLTTIKLLAHLLQRTPLNDEDRINYLKTIATECDRQIEFVGNLLDVSRIEAGAYTLRQERLEVIELITSCVEVERHRAALLGLELIAEIPNDLPPVRGDFEPLRRVVRGLIDNALKYTPAGGTVTVSVHRAGETLAIAVKDNGLGILPVDMSHVFEKFYRAGAAQSDGGANQSTALGTAAPGVGLGLYLAQRVVAQLNGKIVVASEDGRGTIFTVILPLWIDDSDAEAKNEV